MARRKTRQPIEVRMNMTSMMDIVFQLIIFFILVTNFATADLPELDPPTPANSNALQTDDPTVRMVNVVPMRSADPAEFGVASHALLLGQPYAMGAEGMKALTAALVKMKDDMAARDVQIKVDLRADRTLRFDQVQPVMMAVTAAGITRVNLVARLDSQR